MKIIFILAILAMLAVFTILIIKNKEIFAENEKLTKIFISGFIIFITALSLLALTITSIRRI